MARIRTIKPEFWEDTKIAKLSREARLLYIGLWNFADDAGVLIASQALIKARIFPFDQIQNQQFDKWMQELVKLGFVNHLSYKEDNFYHLPNLTRHQKFDPRYPNLLIPKAELEIALTTKSPHAEYTPGTHRGHAGHPLREGEGEEGKGKGKGYNPHTTSDEVVSPPTGGRTLSKSDFSKRKEKFKAEVRKHLDTYGRELLNAFYAYWTEPNKSGTKMKFELERTWDLSRRLARWAANDKGFADKSGSGKWMSYNEAAKYWSAADPQDNWICDPQTKLWRRK